MTAPLDLADLERLEREMVGRRFGKLVVVERSGTSDHGFLWLCRCDCGGSVRRIRNDLNRGRCTSCGCGAREKIGRAKTRHGDARKHSKTAEYSIWNDIRKRCENPRATHYSHYGGRGIKVCERWRSYSAFLADMGRRPSPAHSIDRINVDGDYEPGNVRWATREQQCANKRNTKYVLVDGERMHQAEAARRLGVSPATVLRRSRNGRIQQVT